MQRFRRLKDPGERGFRCIRPALRNSCGSSKRKRMLRSEAGSLLGFAFQARLLHVAWLGTLTLTEAPCKIARSVGHPAASQAKHGRGQRATIFERRKWRAFCTVPRKLLPQEFLFLLRPKVSLLTVTGSELNLHPKSACTCASVVS